MIALVLAAALLQAGSADDNVTSAPQAAPIPEAEEAWVRCALEASDKLEPSGEPASVVAQGAVSVCHHLVGAAMTALVKAGAFKPDVAAYAGTQYEKALANRVLVHVMTIRADRAQAAQAHRP